MKELHNVIPPWHGEGRAPTPTQLLAQMMMLVRQARVQAAPLQEDPSTANVTSVTTPRCLLDRLFCECDLMFCTCFFFFISQLTFSNVCQPTFSKLFHMTWLQPKKRCYADFLKGPPNKN